MKAFSAFLFSALSVLGGAAGACNTTTGEGDCAWVSFVRSSHFFGDSMTISSGMVSENVSFASGNLASNYYVVEPSDTKQAITITHPQLSIQQTTEVTVNTGGSYFIIMDGTESNMTITLERLNEECVVKNALTRCIVFINSPSTPVVRLKARNTPWSVSLNYTKKRVEMFPIQVSPADAGMIKLTADFEEGFVVPNFSIGQRITELREITLVSVEPAGIWSIQSELLQLVLDNNTVVPTPSFTGSVCVPTLFKCKSAMSGDKCGECDVCSTVDECDDIMRASDIGDNSTLDTTWANAKESCRCGLPPLTPTPDNSTAPDNTTTPTPSSSGVNLPSALLSLIALFCMIWAQ